MLVLLQLLRVLTFVFAVILFLQGFFPLKINNLETANKRILTDIIENQIQSFSNGASDQNPTSNFSSENKQKKTKVKTDGDSDAINTNPANNFNLPFKRLILLIIDAFRADFYFGHSKNMPKLHTILKKGNGLYFIAESHPPTVTMPRIKVGFKHELSLCKNSFCYKSTFFNYCFDFLLCNQ